MIKKGNWGIVIAGGCAGAVNGLLGAGGGMVLVPLLSALTDLEEDAIFPSSVFIILPVCIISLLGSQGLSAQSFRAALPYLAGSIIGGVICGLFGRKIPTKWLHKLLGLLILWGGVRYLC